MNRREASILAHPTSYRTFVLDPSDSFADSGGRLLDDGNRILPPSCKRWTRVIHQHTLTFSGSDARLLHAFLPTFFSTSAIWSNAAVGGISEDPAVGGASKA